MQTIFAIGEQRYIVTPIDKSLAIRVDATESIEESSNDIRNEPTVQVEGHLPENNYQIKTCMNSNFY